MRKMFGGEKIIARGVPANLSTRRMTARTSGLNVGEKIPDFTLPDQYGNAENFRDLAGAEGLLLVFTRSADW